MTKTETFLGEAAHLLGPKGLSTDPSVLSPWLTDWRGRYTGRALALASPETTQQVSELLKLCEAHGVAVVPQGGNSGMVGGATPDESGTALLLSLRRMTKVRELDPVNRKITCEAGLVLQVLHETAAANGLRFPLTLGGKGSATIGGLISTNAGGNQVLRHGSMRALVLGLEAVLADGSVFSMLTPLKKDNRGFDLKQLLIGSEGTLGIVTAATLKLVPAIADRVVIWAGLPSLNAARALLLHCEDRAGQQLEGFEVIPHSCLQSVLAYLPDARSPLGEDHAWHAVIEVVADKGQAPALRELCEAMLAAAFEEGLVEDAALAASEAQAEVMWLIRESIAPAERAQGAAVQHDISVAVEKMPEFVDAIVPVIEADWPGTRAIAFGHLGDGNVHFHVIAPAGVHEAAWQESDAVAISSQVYDMVVAWGGSISAEHGIGQHKRDELRRLGDPVSLAMMSKVKQALDPAELLNPGKLI